jgi:hypothetical protein
MPTFNNPDSLMKHLESQMVNNLQKIGDEVKSWLRNNVRLLWYERDFTPQAYTRTMELIECISVRPVKKTGNGQYQVEIFFDTDKMNTYPASDGEWSKHESITTGTDVRLMIPSFIEWGQDSPLFSYAGVHPVEITISEIEQDKYIITRMRELLESKGYKCV